jgi:hypothetical protein
MKAKGAHETDSRHSTLSVSLDKRAEATYEPTRNTVAKKRACQQSVDSDYLFGNFLQHSAFRSTDNKANLNRRLGPIRERLFLRKIESSHQGSIAGYKIAYRDPLENATGSVS